MDRYVCIHGHFYQPPRENPWLEAIELQDSAYPYHDWNERITAECYSPNATSRIMDADGRIARLSNNYSRISFNFGPTLLAWLQCHSPYPYESILEADRLSRENFSGHGSALAQAYNHMILPLANRRDKETQIVWGIRDFEHRFGRKPEGMWLPETAVDLETLDILADHGILFTILAPHQAGKTRPIGTSEWLDVSGGRIDPTMPYRLTLPSKRSMSLFFYDGPIARAVAFEGLLDNGERFADRVLEALNENRSGPQMAHIATDGESYGHHHKDGDMALAYALNYIESNNLATLTNYGEYLERFPPTHEVEIIENSSWSCIHGIERWRANCGCNSGGYPQWNQSWRAPLREALDWLRDSLSPAFQKAAETLVKEPWSARNDYIEVVLNRSPESVERFLEAHSVRTLREDEKIKLFKLMELQRHAMLMYTSCGWFFDELSGMETVQVLQYAGRVVQLAQELFGGAIESQFIDLLESAPSNIPEHEDGRRIYEKWVKPSVLDLTRVAAHYAVSCLFEEYADESGIFSYVAIREAYGSSQAGRAKFAVGRARLVSRVTMECGTMMFAVLHLGDHNLSCGVRDYGSEAYYEALAEELAEPFAGADFPEIIRLMDKHFGVSTYSLRALFRDEQRKAMNQILEPTLAEANSTYRQIYEYHAPLIRFLRDSGMPVPKPLEAAAECVLNNRLRLAFETAPLDTQSIASLLEESRLAGIPLETTTLEFALRMTIKKMAADWQGAPENSALFENLLAGVTLAQSMPFPVNLRSAQDICYGVIQDIYLGIQRLADQGSEQAQDWGENIRSLAKGLWLKLD